MPFSIRLIFAGLQLSTSAACAVVTRAGSRSRRPSVPTRRDLTVGLPPTGMAHPLEASQQQKHLLIATLAISLACIRCVEGHDVGIVADLLPARRFSGCGTPPVDSRSPRPLRLDQAPSVWE